MDNFGAAAGSLCADFSPPNENSVSVFLVLHLLVLTKATPPRLVPTAMRIHLASPQAFNKQQEAPRVSAKHEKKRNEKNITLNFRLFMQHM